jgi:hypothetical protein
VGYFEPGPNCTNASPASAMVLVALHCETSNTGSDVVGTRNDCGFADDDRWRSAKTRYIVPFWNLKLSSETKSGKTSRRFADPFHTRSIANATNDPSGSGFISVTVPLKTREARLFASAKSVQSLMHSAPAGCGTLATTIVTTMIRTTVRVTRTESPFIYASFLDSAASSSATISDTSNNLFTK